MDANARCEECHAPIPWRAAELVIRLPLPATVPTRGNPIRPAILCPMCAEIARVGRRLETEKEDTE